MHTQHAVSPDVSSVLLFVSFLASPQTLVVGLAHVSVLYLPHGYSCVSCKKKKFLHQPLEETHQSLPAPVLGVYFDLQLEPTNLHSAQWKVHIVHLKVKVDHLPLHLLYQMNSHYPLNSRQVPPFWSLSVVEVEGVNQKIPQLVLVHLRFSNIWDQLATNHSRNIPW